VILDQLDQLDLLEKLVQLGPQEQLDLLEKLDQLDNSVVRLFTTPLTTQCMQKLFQVDIYLQLRQLLTSQKK
jgi:hypothetical protein